MPAEAAPMQAGPGIPDALFGIVCRMDAMREPFECRRCGACCRVPGIVRVTDADVDALAACLGLSPEAFADRYTVLAPGRTGLALAGAPDGPCIFLTEDNLCRVHRARPAQCRDYPVRWRSDAIEAVCAAMKGQMQ